jgi:hypothetical protein
MFIKNINIIEKQDSEKVPEQKIPEQKFVPGFRVITNAGSKKRKNNSILASYKLRIELINSILLLHW